MKKFDINNSKYIDHQKKEANLMRILSLILNDIKNIKQFFPTLVSIELSKDLSHLNLYVSFKNSEEKALALLKNAKGFVRSQLAHSINMKYTPDISFKLDFATKNGLNVERILKKIKEDDSNE